MAGAMRKIGSYLGLVEEDDYEYDDEYDDRPADPGYDEPGPALRVSRPEESTVSYTAPRRTHQQAAAPAAAEPYRITTLHPRTYNEARVIGEHFRDGSPVIMNLSDMDDSDAKRLVDFAAGLIFGRHGSIEKVTQKVFLLTPANVQITAEDKSRMAGAGFFNQS